jgi:hypothetical protein
MRAALSIGAGRQVGQSAKKAIEVTPGAGDTRSTGKE